MELKRIAAADELEPRGSLPLSAASESLRRGIIVTHASPLVAWSMIVSFLLLLFAVPVVQIALEFQGGRPLSVAGIDLSGGIPSRSELQRYEEALQEQSQAVRFFQPRVQQWLCAHGGCGSSTVVVGRDGWLFYRPGIESVVGPGFLDPAQLRRRSRNWREIEATPVGNPDPRPAIIHFKQQLDLARVRLILLPVPDKSSVQGDCLSWRVVGGPPAQNASFASFAEEMEAAGIEVFDPTPERIERGERRYLVHDTHWTPAWMDQVADALARRLRRDVQLPKEELQVEEVDVVGEGDLTESLRLTDGQEIFKPESIRISRVLDRSGQRLSANPKSPVLLLGDSFTNIFSAKPMGWGDSAGLAERLSYHLGHSIDRLARNDAGAFASREMLAHELAQGRNRLAGKKVVVWEFAARELSLGDWRLIELSETER